MGLFVNRIVNRTMSSTFRVATGLFVCLLFAAGSVISVGGQIPAGIRDWDDQIKYSRGQNVVPVFEGWVENRDGTFSLIFGYFNRNWEENVFIPVGPDNRIDGGPDRGQPTVFTPRRERNKFEIIVPKDFGTKEVVWTLTSRGRTEKAYGVLVPQEVLTRRMVLANTGRDFSDDDTGDEQSVNVPATITIDPVEPVTRPNRATLAVSVTDDGTRPRGYAFGRQTGRPVRVTWATYRGPALVAFEPPRKDLPDPKGGKLTTAVTFPMPGNYTLRATAVDIGGYTTNKDVTVVVK